MWLEIFPTADGWDAKLANAQVGSGLWEKNTHPSWGLQPI